MIRLSPGNWVKLQKKIVRDYFGRRGTHLRWRVAYILRNLKRNTKKLWYSNYTENVPILDENGDETGDYDNGYSSTEFFYATLSASRGNAYADMFGTNLDYTRTASTVENLPIKEESIVWTSEPILNADGTVDKESADYTVAGIADGINGLVIALKARKKNA